MNNNLTKMFEDWALENGIPVEEYNMLKQDKLNEGCRRLTHEEALTQMAETQCKEEQAKAVIMFEQRELALKERDKRTDAWLASKEFDEWNAGFMSKEKA